MGTCGSLGSHDCQSGAAGGPCLGTACSPELAVGGCDQHRSFLAQHGEDHGVRMWLVCFAYIATGVVGPI